MCYEGETHAQPLHVCQTVCVSYKVQVYIKVYLRWYVVVAHRLFTDYPEMLLVSCWKTFNNDRRHIPDRLIGSRMSLNVEAIQIKASIVILLLFAERQCAKSNNAPPMLFIYVCTVTLLLHICFSC